MAGGRLDDFDTLNAAGHDDAFGIWSNGTTMWVADITDDNDLRLQHDSTEGEGLSPRISTRLQCRRQRMAPQASGRTGPPCGWLDTGDDDKLYAYNMTRPGRGTPSKDFDTLACRR